LGKAVSVRSENVRKLFSLNVASSLWVESLESIRQDLLVACLHIALTRY
jgi:hypothetical protein